MWVDIKYTILHYSKEVNFKLADSAQSIHYIDKKKCIYSYQLYEDM